MLGIAKKIQQQKQLQGPQSIGLVWAFFWLHLLAQPIYALLPAALELTGTQVIVGSSTAFAFSHLWVSRGPKAALRLLALCLVIAGGFEVLSIHTGLPFGQYSYLDATGSSKLGPTWFGLPVLVPLCWQMMAWNAINIAKLIAPKVWTLPIAALAMTAWDVFLDPQMVRHGYWTWTRTGEYVGIPLENYAGWFLTSILIFWIFEQPEHKSKSIRLPPLFDALPVISYGFTWLGSSIVNWFWWGQALVGCAGFVTMGGFAVPAIIKLMRPTRRQ